MTTWTDQRDEWVQGASRKQILRVIARVAAGYDTDEDQGDWGERAETILWLATRGKKGSEWGHAGDPAQEVGGWTDADGEQS
jgi:hypothetical protein